MKKQAVLTMCFLLAALGAQARERLLFDADWLFTLNPKEKQVERADFNDAKWRRLTVPVAVRYLEVWDGIASTSRFRPERNTTSIS